MYDEYNSLMEKLKVTKIQLKVIVLNKHMFAYQLNMAIILPFIICYYLVLFYK